MPHSQIETSVLVLPDRPVGVTPANKFGPDAAPQRDLRVQPRTKFARPTRALEGAERASSPVLQGRHGIPEPVLCALDLPPFLGFHDRGSRDAEDGRQGRVGFYQCSPGHGVTLTPVKLTLSGRLRT